MDPNLVDTTWKFLQWNTNAPITTFLINNVVLFYILRRIIGFIAKKTPWTWDDDLSPFLKDLKDNILKKELKEEVKDIKEDIKNG